MSDPMGNKSKVIQIKNGIIGPIQPKKISINHKKIGDYPDIPKDYLKIACNYSSTRLLGPPICDELIELIQHMFTEEEASIVKHFKPYKVKTAKSIALDVRRPVDDIQSILDTLANKKCILASFGKKDKSKYFMMPLVPGTFEWVLLHPREKDLTNWHHRFAELFEALFETGFLNQYSEKYSKTKGLPPVRYIPIEQSIDSNPMALPSDRLIEILDMYDQFAVGICQCRTTKKIVGEDCGKPLEVCSAFGPLVDKIIARGKMRRVEKNELIEIKKEAEANGLITWMMNVNEKTAKFGNASCSCCGCCCPMLGTISKFNTPGLIAPPHFMPKFYDSKCTHCGKCARSCQMGAITVDTISKTLFHDKIRCIGCGQCVIACDQEHAVEMEEKSLYKKSPESYAAVGAKMLAAFSKASWSIWKERR